MRWLRRRDRQAEPTVETEIVEYLRGTPADWDKHIGQLTPTRQGGLALVGPCPRCGDPIRKDLRELTAPALGQPQAGRRMVIRVMCNCTGAHPGAEPGVIGCGAEGGVELEL